MISAAAADWRAAGSGGADCDPKDVAGMVEDYVIEKKEDASSQQKKKKKKKPSHSLLNTTELADMGCFFWHIHRDENEQLLMHCKHIAHFCFNNRCNELQQKNKTNESYIEDLYSIYLFTKKKIISLITN